MITKSGGTRERNPERSRERILAAALEEFAAHGFAGARVSAIAERAGLNKQLISHHFGGKEGLYQAVMRDRRSRPGGDLAGPPGEHPDALAALFERGRTDPLFVRVLLWEALEAPLPDDDTDDTRRALYRERVAWIRDEQEAGRLPAAFDPEILYLMLVGASVYPVILPRVCELVTGDTPANDEFAQRYADQLRLLARTLAGDA
ncbi:MAG: TetR family transcriptional regulator [Acidimicrobiia bacterium]